MDREQLEHIIRSAGEVLGEDPIIIGSQSILGSFPDDLPKNVMMSREADVMAAHDPGGSKALRINALIGELSKFDETHGYYAEGVEEGLSRFPSGWRDRLIPVNNPNTNGYTGLCVEPHDQCVAKLLAGREKDFQWARALVISGHVRPEILIERLAQTDATDSERHQFLQRLEAFRRPGRGGGYRRALRKARNNLEARKHQSVTVRQGNAATRKIRTRTICNALMPRAKARCVLPAGHFPRSPHRSKI